MNRECKYFHEDNFVRGADDVNCKFTKACMNLANCAFDVIGKQSPLFVYFSARIQTAITAHYSISLRLDEIMDSDELQFMPLQTDFQLFLLSPSRVDPDRSRPSISRQTERKFMKFTVPEVIIIPPITRSDASIGAGARALQAMNQVGK